MSNKYRVTLSDSFKGKSFTFAVHYHSQSSALAEAYALAEWKGLTVLEVRKV